MEQSRRDGTAMQRGGPLGIFSPFGELADRNGRYLNPSTVNHYKKPCSPFRPAMNVPTMLCSLSTKISNTSTDKPMPKMKTHKGTKKRFRLTASGHAKHRQSGTSHLQARMSQKRKRKLRGTTTVDKCMEASIREALAGNSY